MDLKLNGKNAAVVGATRGIGRAIAGLLVSEGCNVSICARTESSVESTVAALAEAPVKVRGEALDAVDRRAQSAWIERTADSFGGVDIFIANASAMNLDADEGAWRHSFEVDMLSSYFGAEAAIPFLKKSEAGAIVFISSIAALHTPGGAKPYGAMKAAILNYSKGLARSLAVDGIRVNAVSPGNIYFEDGVWGRTERDNPEFFASAVANNPMGRMGRPDEVASAAVYLASPAASFISGANLIVDGALTLGVQY